MGNALCQQLPKAIEGTSVQERPSVAASKYNIARLKKEEEVVVVVEWRPRSRLPCVRACTHSSCP